MRNKFLDVLKLIIYYFLFAFFCSFGIYSLFEGVIAMYNNEVLWIYLARFSAACVFGSILCALLEIGFKDDKKNK